MHAGGEQLLIARARRVMGEMVVRLRPVGEDLDIDPPPHRGREQLAKGRIREEIGVADVEGAAGPGDREDEGTLRGGQSGAGKAVDQAGRMRPAPGLRLREECAAHQKLARRLAPLLDERRLELRDRRPGEADVRLPPMTWSAA
jgi:hypothetical protein